MRFLVYYSVNQKCIVILYDISSAASKFMNIVINEWKKVRPVAMKHGLNVDGIWKQKRFCTGHKVQQQLHP